MSHDIIDAIKQNIHESVIARRHHREGRTDDRLSLAASALLRFRQREDAVIDDIHAFGGDVPADFARRQDAKLEAELAGYGMTLDKLHVVAKARTTAKFCYTVGL